METRVSETSWEAQEVTETRSTRTKAWPHRNRSSKEALRYAVNHNNNNCTHYHIDRRSERVHTPDEKQTKPKRSSKSVFRNARIILNISLKCTYVGIHGLRVLGCCNMLKPIVKFKTNCQYILFSDFHRTLEAIKTVLVFNPTINDLKRFNR